MCFKLSEFSFKQECIPVGCVPAARRPYAGVCFPGGCLVWGGGVVPGPGGCAWSGGGVSGLGGWGGVWSGGVGVPGPGVCLSALWDTTTTPPPVNRMTNRCKNITLATTSLRPVINIKVIPMFCKIFQVFSKYGYYKYLK